MTAVSGFVTSAFAYMRASVVWWLAAAILLVLVAQGAFLVNYPSVFIDEPWYANAAWNWFQTGVNFDTVHAGTLDQFGYEWVRWPYLGNLPWVLSFAILGLGLFQARLVSWTFGLLLLLGTVFVGRRAYSLVVGVLAVLLLALSPAFTQASHYARPDMMLAAAIMLVYWLALFSFERERWWAHLLTGLVLGLAVDIHQNAGMFMPALAGLYVVTYRNQVLHERGTWWCAAGGVIGVAYYGLAHIAPNPTAYFTLFEQSFGGSHRIPLLAALAPLNLASSLTHEVGRYHFFDNSLDFALIGASAVYLAVRRSRSDVNLLTFVASAFVCFVLFVGNKHDVYAILLYPFLMLLVAEALVSLFREAGTWPRARRGFAIALVVLMLASNAVRFARPLLENRDYDYYAVTDQIRSVIPAGARVMGLPHWWLGLADYDYRSSLNLTFYHFYNDYSLTQGLEADRPEYLVVDSALRALLVDEDYFPPGPGFAVYRLPRNEFEAFLSQRGSKVQEFDNPWHGRFEIYRINWDAAR